MKFLYYILQLALNIFGQITSARIHVNFHAVSSLKLLLKIQEPILHHIPQPGNAYIGYAINQWRID